jgi:hypothetical protein
LSRPQQHALQLQQQSDLAQEQRERAVVTWRNKVVAACQGGNAAALDDLLSFSAAVAAAVPSPLNNTEAAASALPTTADGGFDPAGGALLLLDSPLRARHLEVLVPLCIAKNRSQYYRGMSKSDSRQQQQRRLARLRLFQYLLPVSPPCMLQPIRTNGRSVFHTACFYGDILMVQSILDIIAPKCFRPRNRHHQESGWLRRDRIV